MKMRKKPRPSFLIGRMADAVSRIPALTIAAIAERGVEIALAQLEKEGAIRAEGPS